MRGVDLRGRALHLRRLRRGVRHPAERGCAMDASNLRRHVPVLLHHLRHVRALLLPERRTQRGRARRTPRGHFQAAPRGDRPGSLAPWQLHLSRRVDPGQRRGGAGLPRAQRPPAHRRVTGAGVRRGRPQPPLPQDMGGERGVCRGDPVRRLVGGSRLGGHVERPRRLGVSLGAHALGRRGLRALARGVAAPRGPRAPAAARAAPARRGEVQPALPLHRRFST
mmetsp:Transcript_51406/g.149489  ORF Transcript_51406/g.149489 Transcript_51406/m.149489 type:complete len:223 (-) Transcript_51406:104-772(-)